MIHEQNQHLVEQHLRSIVLHSIDNFNYNNAEFAGERLLAHDPKNLNSLYLYCLVLFHQKKYKTCYSKLVELDKDHLGCSYIFGKLCLHLKKYKEGIFQLLKVSYLYNDSSNEEYTSSQFESSVNKYQYEFNRTTSPDKSSIYHLLGDLYSKISDIKNSSLNYSYCLKHNQFDFEAFQKLCKLGVDVKVKALFKQQKLSEEDKIVPTYDDVTSPFQSQDDTFSLLTPRIKTPAVPPPPLRKLFNGDLNKFEFNKRKQSAPPEKKQSTYSIITSRLISHPHPVSSSNQNPTSGNSEKRSLKRSNTDSNVPLNTHSAGPTGSPNVNEIESSTNYLLQLYTIFGKSYKCFSKYDCYKAIRILESLSENEKNSAWVLSKLGRLHYEIVNYKQSEHFFIKLRKLDRTRLEDMEYYSTLLWHLHKKVELTYLANELYDLDNKSPITWSVIGNLFSLNREPDEAIKCFNKSIKFDENFTYAYTLKGHEFFSNDNYEMALENFRISLLIDPRHYNALYGIGMVYINLGDFEKADYHFRKAVSINPINIILICCVGMVLEKMGKKTLALRQYELANKLQPLNPLPIFKKAQLYFTMQQFQQALKLFEVLKDLAPDEASIHFLLGQLYNIQDDKFQAIKEFTIALNLDPKGNYLIREAMEALQDK